MTIRPSILARSIALGFAVPASALLWHPVHAQTLPDAGTATTTTSVGLEEVVVTARRKRENLQEVPTSVTAMVQKDMVDMKVAGFQNVAQTVPNLTVERQFGSGSAPQFSMRGQDGGSVALQTDNRIGLYVDGVYLGRSGSSAFTLADLCRMEALRGPQGTLFGRNATGGAVNLITCGPAANFGGSVDVGVGNYGQRRAKASIDSGDFAGFSAKLTVLHEQNKGYVKNANPGVVTQLSAPFGTIVSAEDFGREKTDAVGLAARYTGIDKLKVDYRFDSANKRSTQLAVQVLATPGGIGALYNPAFGTGGTVPNLTRQGAVSEEFTGTGTLRNSGHSLTAEYQLSNELTVKNIASYRKLNEKAGGNDIDGTSFNGNFLTFAGIPTAPSQQVCFICSDAVRKQSQVSNELQLLGNHGVVDWIGGLFYFKEKGSANSPVFVGGSFTPGAVNTVGNISQFTPSDYFAGSNVDAANKSTAAYGHANYKLTSDWTFGAGLRRTKDTRQENVLQGPSTPNSQASFMYTDWDAAVNYKVSKAVNTYVKLGTAHLSGGIQSGQAFQPEVNRAVEAGVKSDLFDRRLRLNVAVFSNQVGNQQLSLFSTSTGFITINSGSSTQKGVEVELTARPVSSITLNANYGYVKASSGLGFSALTPKQTLYLGSEYKFEPLHNGTLPSARLDVSWRDKAASGPCQVNQSITTSGCTGTGDAALSDAIALKSRTALGARVSFSDIPLGPQIAGRFSLWGRNLLNSDKLEFARDLGNGIVVGNFQEPRTVGADFTVNF